MSAQTSRPRASALGVVLVASLFVAGPTPGDIGGCGGGLANEPLRGDISQQEYDYFDQAFCANMCLRLRSCGYLCNVIEGGAAGCDNESQTAYQQCVRGNLRRDMVPLGSTMCPRSCGNYRLTYRGASEQDVVTCGHAIGALSCDALADVIRTPPNECLAVCGP